MESTVTKYTHTPPAPDAPFASRARKTPQKSRPRATRPTLYYPPRGYSERADPADAPVRIPRIAEAAPRARSPPLPSLPLPSRLQFTRPSVDVYDARVSSIDFPTRASTRPRQLNRAVRLDNFGNRAKLRLLRVSPFCPFSPFARIRAEAFCDLAKDPLNAPLAPVPFVRRVGYARYDRSDTLRAII